MKLYPRQPRATAKPLSLEEATLQPFRATARTRCCDFSIVPYGPSSFRDAPLGAGPESITTIVSMDSGLDASHRPGMTRGVSLRLLDSSQNSYTT
jgi:hypothetical protein